MNYLQGVVVELGDDVPDCGATDGRTECHCGVTKAAILRRVVGVCERGTGYVLAVRSNYSVTLPSGRRVTVKTAASLVKPAMWQRMRTGSATKGAKDYHWAMIEITPDDTPEGQGDGHAFLLLRRHRYTGTVSYFLCWSPGPVPLAKLISIAVTRWRIEEDHQLTKQVAGLDSGSLPLMILPALSEALFMATMRAAISEATISTEP